MALFWFGVSVSLTLCASFFVAKLLRCEAENRQIREQNKRLLGENILLREQSKRFFSNVE